MSNNDRPDWAKGISRKWRKISPISETLCRDQSDGVRVWLSQCHDRRISLSEVIPTFADAKSAERVANLIAKQKGGWASD